ncbi:MAG: hypothetical protein RMK49_15475 [Abditibacteriales bacterium]|nr:hypothetical protein [Abditibacteriales bacterium]
MEWPITTRAGLICCVAAGVVAAAAGNLLVAVFGWGGDWASVIPAGWEWVDRVVGYVWLGLFACLTTPGWLGTRPVRRGR